MEIWSMSTFSITQQLVISLENSKKWFQKCHLLIFHINVSGMRPNTKFTLSIDKEKHSELSSRRMITLQWLKLNSKKSLMSISEPCTWSKRHVLFAEVLVTFCSSREFMMRKPNNGTGPNTLNFNTKVFFTLSKETLESISQLTKRYSSILLTIKNLPQFLKT